MRGGGRGGEALLEGKQGRRLRSVRGEERERLAKKERIVRPIVTAAASLFDFGLPSLVATALLPPLQILKPLFLQQPETPSALYLLPALASPNSDHSHLIHLSFLTSSDSERLMPGF